MYLDVSGQNQVFQDTKRYHKDNKRYTLDTLHFGQIHQDTFRYTLDT